MSEEMKMDGVLAECFFHNLPEEDDWEVHDPRHMSDGGCEKCVPAVIVSRDAWQARASLSVGVPDVLTEVERKAIVGLIELASHAFHVADNGEDAGGETISVPRCDMDDLGNALDSLDELPDDMPGYTLGPSGRAEWALRRFFGGTTIAGQESIAPTVKAEQVDVKRLQLMALRHLQYVREPDDHYVTGTTGQALDFIRDMIGVDIRLTDKAPSLPAAGSAWEEVEVVAWLDEGPEQPDCTASRRVMMDWANCGYTIAPLMTVAQHNRIVAALSAQQSAQLVGGDSVSVPRELLKGVIALIEQYVPFPTAAGAELRALLSRNGNGGGV